MNAADLFRYGVIVLLILLVLFLIWCIRGNKPIVEVGHQTETPDFYEIGYLPGNIDDEGAKK